MPQSLKSDVSMVCRLSQPVSFFSLMEGPSLVQCFCFIISLAPLAYTFTVLHTIQYSMQNHDNSTTQNPQDHDLTDYSALSSTHDTLANTINVRTAEKTSGWWTKQEINLLLNYVERNSILTTASRLSGVRSWPSRTRVRTGPTP